MRGCVRKPTRVGEIIQSVSRDDDPNEENVEIQIHEVQPVMVEPGSWSGGRGGKGCVKMVVSECFKRGC